MKARGLVVAVGLAMSLLGGLAAAKTPVVLSGDKTAAPADGAAGLTLPASSPAPGGPAIGLRLLADRTALVPGQRAALAIQFEIPRGWHIYWQNRGEGGMAPTFAWRLPEGFSVGPIRYPPPDRHVDAAGAHTFVLQGEPVLLTELHVPAGARPGQQVTLGVDARWLACRDVCVLGSRTLELTLPVVADAGQGKPAHAEEFDWARRRLPQPPGQAKYLRRLRAAADVDRVAPGAAFRVAVVLELEPGFHVNAHRPLLEGLIPTDVFPYAVEGLQFGRPVFPPGAVKKSPLGDVALYGGREVVVLPVEADAVLKGDTIRLAGVLEYQACSDETMQCFPPAGAEWELTLPVARAGQAVRPAHGDLFGPPAPATPEKEALPSERSWLQRAQARLARLGIAGYLVMALIGGFILNLTPCVLPVISIKVLSFVQQAGQGRLRVFTLGLAFAAGIEVSFLAFGGIILGLGRHLGVSQQWGGLFQSPQVVIGLAAVVLAFALSLFGVFALNPPRVVNELGEKVRREGHLGAFGTGLLATLLGTACTAPFLSAVVAIAVRQPVAAGMLIFAAAGAGMACPYVLLAAQPAWIRVVPRPGPWMTTFEHAMGFVLLGIALWLLSPLPVQVGVEGLQLTLIFLLLVAVAAWVYGRLEFGAPLGRKLRVYGLIVLLVAGGWIVCFRVVHTLADLAADQRATRQGSISGDGGWTGGKIPWVRYDRAQARQAAEAGRTVFIDYTAQWCKVCTANEKLVLNSAAVREAMQRLHVVPFKADFTSYDLEIKADLDRFGRSGVPMYVVIPAGRPDEPILLDEVITPSSVIAALERAGPGLPASAPAAQ